jgi:UDP-N-acetylmuramoyl-tripeptide--D-alanyl-D-alanine ligase
VVLALGEMAEQVAEGARRGGIEPARARAFSDLYELLEAAQELLRDNYVVLIKGSRAMKMERVVGALAMFEWEAA